MSELYIPDLHLDQRQQAVFQNIKASFSGTVIFVKEAELNQTETKSLLDNIIIKGLKMKLEEVFVSSYSALCGGLRLYNIKAELPVKHIISFGISPEQIGLNVSSQYFQVLKVDTLELLHVPSLTDISKKKTMKANLWGALKAMYNI